MHGKSFLVTFVLLMIAGVTLMGCNGGGGSGGGDSPPAGPAQNNDGGGETPQSVTSTDEIEVPKGFTFATTRRVAVAVTVLDPAGGVIPNVSVRILESGEDSETVFVGLEEKVLYQGITDSNGKVTAQVEMPTRVQTVNVLADVVGLPPASGTISENTLTLTVGGVPDRSERSVLAFRQGEALSEKYVMLGDWNSKGVPAYLFDPPDSVSLEFLENVNASLPEYRTIPEIYLANGVTTELRLTGDAEIWVTFVHEGAGWRNAVGYYVYDAASPPATKEDIDKLYILFPNSSFAGSGGGLYSGDKIQLRYFPDPEDTETSQNTFPSGKVVGWFLVGNGWQNRTVGDGNHVVFSNPEFNPDDPDYPVAVGDVVRQHNVLLNDSTVGGDNARLLIGFEDLLRDNTSQYRCDNDFNDAIFFATVTPKASLDLSGVEEMVTETDTDGDGIVDALDAYPNDEKKAMNNWFPGTSGTYGTLGYEDLWPEKGDYDFNDLVVDYRINQITDAAARIVAIEGSFIVKAIGAGYRNGFAFLLPNADSEDIDSVSVTLLGGGTPAGAGIEGLEVGSVITLFSDAYALFGRTPAEGFINVYPDKPLISPVTLTVSIAFATPKAASGFGYPPYNPFITVNQNPFQEVHLPGHAPSSRANGNLFGTGDDATSLVSGTYYQTGSGHPWAIHCPGGWNHMVESNDILNGYLRFVTWAESGGASYPDWYMDKSGYRNTGKIYTAP